MQLEKNISVNKYYSEDLINQAQNGNKEALETLVLKNQPLIKSIIKRYYYLNESIEDISQIANIGLIKAIKRFDLSYETQFSTYAVYLINGEVKKYFRDNGYVKAGRKLREVYTKSKSYIFHFLSENGYEPGIKEISENISEDIETITFAFNACSNPDYLDAPMFSNEEGERRLKDTVPDEGNKIESGLGIIDLKNALLKLGKQERQIIVLRYIKNYSQVKTGQIMGKSQVQISRMEKKILNDIKIKLLLDE